MLRFRMHINQWHSVEIAQAQGSLRLIFATVFACQLDAKKLKMLALEWSGGWPYFIL